MQEHKERCPHAEGLQTFGLEEFRCPVCGEEMSLQDVERWVRTAEKTRDDAHSQIKGDTFGEIAREELQREVYRRRKVLYGLKNAPRVMAPRPEMVLVVYDETGDDYECRVFYKEPRPAWGVERFGIRASSDSILDLRSHGDPVVRRVAEKVGEFHAARQASSADGAAAPARRVFYANEL